MIQKVKQEKIGSVYRVKHNGMRLTVTISNDPSQFKFYSDLGLDIFEYVPTANVEIKKVNDSTGQSNSKPKRKGSTNR